MDNGLIFPYRRSTAQHKTIMIVAPRALMLWDSLVGVLWCWCVVLGRECGGVSVLTGVTQEGSQTVAMVDDGQDCSTGIR